MSYRVALYIRSYIDKIQGKSSGNVVTRLLPVGIGSLAGLGL